MKLEPISSLPPVGSPFAEAEFFVMRLDGPKDLRAPFNAQGIANLARFLGTVGDWRWGRIDELAALLSAPSALVLNVEVNAELARENARLREVIEEAADVLRRGETKFTI